MLLSESITRIRRLIRDTNSSVFSVDSIIRVWNEVQMQVALRTSVFERVINLSVPAISYFTYTHNWEEDYIAKPSTVVYNLMGSNSYTQPWEVAVDAGTEPAVTGGYTGTQNWEVFYASLQNRLRHYFPDDYIEMTYAAYDNRPLECIYREDVGNVGQSFKTLSGTKPSLYVEDKESNTFFLYPRVEVNGITEVSGEYGEVVYAEGSNDSLNPSTDYGVIVFSLAEDMDSNYGVVIRVQVPEDALQIIYRYTPNHLTASTDTIEWPKWVVKFMECRVISRLLVMETDLFNKDFAQLFHNLYEAGLKIIERYKSKQNSVRRYKMDSSGAMAKRSKKLADLPSHYESYWR